MKDTPITKGQLFELCKKFSESDNVKSDSTKSNGLNYGYDSHLILLKRGIEVTRITLYYDYADKKHLLKMTYPHIVQYITIEEMQGINKYFNEYDRREKFPAIEKLIELL